MGHSNDILDDELASPKDGRARELIWLWALFFTVISAVLYTIPLLVIYPDFGEKASPQNEFLSGLLSFLHLFVAMLMMNTFVDKNYQKLLKGGYYILIFGSGIFLLGSILSIFDVIVPARDGMAENQAELSFWGENYEAIITIFIVFLKFLLIKPMAFFLTIKD